MKTTFGLISVFLLFAVSLPAQVKPSPVDAIASDKTVSVEIGDIGDHHRVWQRVTTETDRYSNKISVTNALYTELETGMNVRQPDGTYLPASDEIEITGNGAVARKTRHSVFFAPNCNSPIAVTMVTADGKKLQSRILGLAFYNKATGESVMIAEIKDSEGQLLMDSKNEVVYFDALTDIKCDIRYRNSKAGLEQDLILRESVPSPADYKLSPESTVLEVLTEFVDPPLPVMKEQVINGNLDHALDFGDLQMGNGQVYVMGKETTGIPVSKQWGTMEGRTFLAEEIPYATIEPELKNLPVSTASLKPASDGVLHQVSAKRLLPRYKQAKKSTGIFRTASAPLGGKGIVLDYTTASSATNYTFRGDTTYYVSGNVILSGTNTTFEAGAVFKFAPTNTPKLNITSPITWQGSMYRPIVMTGRDDNTAGDSITGSTGNPNTNYFANPALYIDGTAAGTNAILQNLRISYAQSAIVFNGKTGHVVSHAQFVKCANGITATNAEFSLRNGLLYNVLTNFNGSSATGRCEHLTINTASWMNKSSAITLTLTNSLLAGVTNAGTFTSNTVNTVTSAAFLTVGAGSHYLATNTYRNVGTTNINANLAADLRKLTTYPPIELTTDFTVDTTLSTQAARDTDDFDLGYHYDPLDYVVGGRTLTNSTLTLTNGIALGNYGPVTSYGVYIRKGGTLISEGTPTQLNRIVRYNTSQEQATTNWSASSVGYSVKISPDAAPQANASFRFTGWSALAGTCYHFSADYIGISSQFAFTDCQIAPGSIRAAMCSAAFTNCLLERVSLQCDDDGDTDNYYSFNSLYRYGTLTLARIGAGTWIFKDNLFEQTTISQSGTITHGYNGYVTNANRMTPNGTGDVILTNVPIYQTSYLGRFYYPTNGGLLSALLNVGSRNATNAGLYHYTVTTNQVKETNSTVDIGFHYVATTTNGIPIDTDGDGVTDYREDRNGNGSSDTGETDWKSYNSPNGFSNGAGLQVFTPLK